MAVIQISRIQHRKGLQQDLPQLASAELGWAVDTRQLYIGNGTIAEGAPEIGITEILTQYSDLFNIAGAYTFRGSQSGYTSRTGPTSDAPITRTLQEKSDDIVNVRDFGAKGDGNTDDTSAIQRAIDEIYFGNFALSTPRLRRIINFPAGIYLINSSLKIPSFASLQGEGKGRTIIRQGSNLYPLMQLKDSENQIDSSYGSGSATVARDITITQMTLENLFNQDVLRLDTTERVLFFRVAFKGSQDSPNSASTSGQNAVYARPLSSTGFIRNLTFLECDFNNCTQGVVANGTDFRFSGCNFKQLSQALIVDTTATPVATKNIKVVNCGFDQISRSAINVQAANVNVYTAVLSSLNYYGDVGTALAGDASPAYPVLTFNGSGNQSTGDFFERSEAAHGVQPRVSLAASSVSASFDANTGISMGMINQGPGRVISLSASQTNANTGVVFTNTTGAARIDYWLKRPTAGAYRQGRIDVIYTGTNVQYIDEYTEFPNANNYQYPGPTGVTFKIMSVNSTTANLTYTSDASGTGTLTYSITKFS